MTDKPTATELAMLHDIRIKADELARLVNEASQQGFVINFNINAVTASCDVFQVSRMVPVDMRGSAN